jgi:KipI family sensor histidine kinase inhibitor
MRVLRYGEQAVLAEPDDPRLVPALCDAVRADETVVEAVPGAATLLVVFDPARTDADRITGLLRAHKVSDRPLPRREPVELPVRYDGADLSSVAEATRMSPDEVVARHAAGEYTVRFCGFTPGFGYLDGLDARLHVPRHAEPRTRVAAGSVGIAGEFTGVYPRPSPGGWQLLGRTDAVLWDPDREPPALLVPGTTVRFVIA